MSPSKLHANLAAGLPVLYVGPAGSNVDEAITPHDAGRSLREGDVDGRGARPSASCAADPTAPAPGPAAFEAAYCDAATLPALRRACSTAEPAQAALGLVEHDGEPGGRASATTAGTGRAGVARAEHLEELDGVALADGRRRRAPGRRGLRTGVGRRP